MDKRQKAEYDLETIMGEAGFNLSVQNKVRVFFREYQTKSMGLVKIVPAFNNDPDSKSFKADEPVTLKEISLIVNNKVTHIPVQKQTTMSEIVGLPYECMFDISTVIVMTRSHASIPVEARYIITEQCSFCQKISKSFVKLDKTYCHACVGI